VSWYRSIFPRAKPVIYIRPHRRRRPRSELAPALKLIAATSIAIAIVSGLMASSHGRDACPGTGASDTRVSDHDQGRECALSPSTTFGAVRP
jgi:hypothetical protein